MRFGSVGGFLFTLKINKQMKYKEIIIGVLSAAAVLGLLFFFASPRADEPAPAASAGSGAPGLAAGTLVPAEASFDFGSISMAKGKVSHTYLIRNTSDAPVLIRKMYTSCMCTEASLTLAGQKLGPFGMPGHALVPSINQKVGPGEEISVEAVFDPAAHGPAGLGRINRAVILEVENGIPVQVVFTANVIP